MSSSDSSAAAAQTRGTSPQLFVQVNTGAEPQKAGVLPDEADGFIAACRALDLPLFGLMCIPPEGQDPVPHFRALRGIAGTAVPLHEGAIRYYKEVGLMK